ncbi:MAG: hypothetical protein Q8L98_02125 [Chlamydiales bacterium]|nr:hypothetical protein [Chlamydiales bacterium]
MKTYILFLLPLIALTGCFQFYDEADNLRTVPVTNNPHIVPSHGSGMPGIGSG